MDSNFSVLGGSAGNANVLTHAPFVSHLVRSGTASLQDSYLEVAFSANDFDADAVRLPADDQADLRLSNSKIFHENVIDRGREIGVAKVHVWRRAGDRHS